MTDATRLLPSSIALGLAGVRADLVAVHGLGGRGFSAGLTMWTETRRRSA
jgi:hypothetical protein